MRLGYDRLEIHCYYFPFGTKSVPYTQISPIVTPDMPAEFEFESVLRDRADLGAGNARRMKGPFI